MKQSRDSEHQRTRHFNIFLVILAVLAAGAIAWTILEARAHVASFATWHGPVGGRGHVVARLCAGDRDTAVEAALAYAEHALDITVAQEAAWQGFADSVREGAAGLDALCSEFEATDGPRNPTQELALAEMAVAAGLDALRQIRPAFDELYAGMTNAQRATLDDLVMRRHHD